MANKFILHLYRLNEDVSKLVQQLRYEQEQLESKIINFNLDKLIEEITSSPATFNRIIDNAPKDSAAPEIAALGADTDEVDVYGNIYKQPYRYAEITYDNIVKISKIRLLGVDGLFKKRFLLEDLENPFSATTLLLLANIREIVKSPKELNIEELFKCKRDAWIKDSEIASGKTLPEYRYSWEYLTKNFFSPPPIYDQSGEMNDAQIAAAIAKYEKKTIQTKKELERELEFIKNNKTKIIKKTEKKIEKAKTPVDYLEEDVKKFGDSLEEIGEEAGKIILNFLDKFSIGCIVEEALKCIKPQNISCKRLFENLPAAEIFDRIALVFPRGSDTFRELELVVEEQIFGKDVVRIKNELKELKLEEKIAENKALRADLVATKPNLAASQQAVIQQRIDNLDSKTAEYEASLKQKKKELAEAAEKLRQDFAFNQRQVDEIVNGGGNIAAILLQPGEGEAEGSIAITQKVIAAIDTVIPFDDLCEAITNALSFSANFPFVNFEGFPSFQFPEPPPVNDVFEGFGAEIGKTFSLILTQALVTLIDGILRELLNCDNLDAFIAQAINSSAKGEQFDPLKQLFDPSKVEGIVNQNYDQFINTIASRSNSILTVGEGSSKINIGLAPQDVQNLFGRSEQPRNTLEDLATAASRTSLNIAGQIRDQLISAQSLDQIKRAQNSWDINAKGDSFETISGVSIIDMAQFDQFIQDLRQQGYDYLANKDKYSQRALLESAANEGTGLELTQPAQAVSAQTLGAAPGQLTITDEEAETIKDDMSCIMRNVVAIISPTQVLALFSGNPTTETLQVAREIILSCSPNNLSLLINSDNDVLNLFNNFGRVSGLDTLADELEVLIGSGEFVSPFPVTKCGPYETVEDFRTDLMSKVIDPQKARQVMDAISQERIEKFNEIAEQILDSTAGIPLNPSVNNPSSGFVNAIKAVLNGQEIDTAPKQRARNTKTAQQEIEQKIKEKYASSPIVQNMFKIALDSLFLPVLQVVNNDIDGFIEAFSDIVETEEPIDRKITINTSEGEVEIINPEFKTLLNNGLVPVLTTKYGTNSDDKYAKMVEKNSLNVIDILGLIQVVQDNEEKKLYVSGESSKNYLEKGLNGTPLRPVLKKTNKKIVGDSLLKNIQNVDVTAVVNRNTLNIDLEGFIDNIENDFLSQVAPNLALPQEAIDALLNNKPRWQLQFSEVKNKQSIENTVSLVTNGKVSTAANGIEDFYIPRFSFTQQNQISDSIIAILEQLYQNTDISRKETFDKILFNNLSPFIFDRNNNLLERDFAASSIGLYSNIIENFIKLSGRGIADAQLLKEASSTNGQSATNIELLQLTKQCEHILDFQKFRREFQKIYDYLESLPTRSTTASERNGTGKRPSNLSKTSKIIMSRLVVKIFALEVALKALISFDYYKYTKDIIENELFINLMCDFVTQELTRISTKNVDTKTLVLQEIKDYYDLLVQFKEKDAITNEERQQFENSGFAYPIELKKVLVDEFFDLLDKLKTLVKQENEAGLDDVDELLKFVIDQVPIVKVHKGLGFKEQERENIITDSGAVPGFILQKYIVIPQVNEDSNVVKQNTAYFTRQKIDEINNYGVLDIEKAEELFTDIYYELGKNFKLFDCDTSNEALFADPYSYGLRLVYVEEKTYTEPKVTIRNQDYPYLLPQCDLQKLGYLREIEKQYDLIQLSSVQIRVNQTEDVKNFTQRRNINRYDYEFFTKLKKELYNDETLKVFFGYSIPMKEMSSMFIMHSSLANNSTKMKYLLEPTKKMLANILDSLDNIGNKTLSSDKFKEMLDKQRAEKENVGNPAGPLNFEAIKPFYRTPIQILKGMATVVDPNIAITDKVVTGAAIAGALVGQKIQIPYSLTSLALLPFPLFTPPPAGIIPPLTAYNITVPIGPIFLGLEPLLWDLPYFKNNSPEAIVCEDEEES